MKLLITGGTGFLGQQLVDALLEAGHDLVLATRQESSSEAFPGVRLKYPLLGDEPALRDVEGIIHLAGENLAGGRWTAERKTKIYNSRISTTQDIVSLIPLLPKVKLFFSASAVGIYGSEEKSTVESDESSPVGSDYLAKLCRDWEIEAMKAARPGLRIALLRTGVVLGRSGGMLKELEPIFRMHMGGAVGSGDQMLSWIHEKDWVRAVLYMLEGPDRAGVTPIQGPVNLTAPEPITNRAFTKALGGILKNQLGLPVPGIFLKAALGEMSMIALQGQFAVPKKLIEANFKFQFPTIREALQNLFDITDDNRTAYDVFETRQWLPIPIEKAFEFFCDENNLEKITPPLLNFHVVNKSTKTIGKGTIINYRLKIRGVPSKWQTLIEDWDPPYGFSDSQKIGPYTKWYHQHKFTPAAGGTLMRDRVQYALPLGTLGRLGGHWLVRKDIEKIFAYRRKVIGEMFKK